MPFSIDEVRLRVVSKGRLPRAYAICLASASRQAYAPNSNAGSVTTPAAGEPRLVNRPGRNHDPVSSAGAEMLIWQCLRQGEIMATDRRKMSAMAVPDDHRCCAMKTASSILISLLSICPARGSRCGMSADSRPLVDGPLRKVTLVTRRIGHHGVCARDSPCRAHRRLMRRSRTTGNGPGSEARSVPRLRGMGRYLRSRYSAEPVRRDLGDGDEGRRNRLPRDLELDPANRTRSSRAHRSVRRDGARTGHLGRCLVPSGVP